MEKNLSYKVNYIITDVLPHCVILYVFTLYSQSCCLCTLCYSILSLLFCCLDMYLANHKSRGDNNLLVFQTPTFQGKQKKINCFIKVLELLIEMKKSLLAGNLSKSLYIDLMILWNSYSQASIPVSNAPWIE